MYVQEYRGFLIKPHSQHPQTLIVATAGKGGKIPQVLNSMFTSRGIAKSKIDSYLAGKGNTDGEASNQS